MLSDFDAHVNTLGVSQQLKLPPSCVTDVTIVLAQRGESDARDLSFVDSSTSLLVNALFGAHVRARVVCCHCVFNCPVSCCNLDA